MSKVKRIKGEKFEFNLALMRGVRDRNNNVVYFDKDEKTLEVEFISSRGGRYHYYAMWAGIDLYLDAEKEAQLKNGERVELFDKEFH